MFVNSVGHYYPDTVVDNQYFEDIHGFDEGWIHKRTGIKERRRSVVESLNVMAVNAVNVSLNKIPYNISDIDIIIGATYTPNDTINTLAHQLQHSFCIDNVIALTVSSACSSFINALEIAEGYICSGKVDKALIVAAEHNTAYSSDQDITSGHLWGDGAAAFFISSERLSEDDIEIKDISTKGLGTIGRSIEGVKLLPAGEGITMPHGRDVFTWACSYMANSVRNISEKNNLKPEDIDYVIPHQANIRIIENVRKQLGLPREKVLTNIEQLGNTGCAGVAIAFSQNIERFKKGDKIAMTVFGGGYSCGAALLEK